MTHKDRKDYYLKDLFFQQYEDKSMDPSRLSDITDNFSKKAEIGSGGFGVVYKGVLRDGFVAVKKFKEAIDDKAFVDEVNCLTKIEHPNIVKYIGYCAGSEKHIAMNEGKTILAESPYQLICFEYLRKGSLDMHLNDKPCGLPWQVCYKIIQGICLGLHHLHEHRIIHRDIKAGNILLDDHMTPKIADFGLSRFLGDAKSRINTRQDGTLGYMAPESMFNGVFTFKSDIYSLGMIIRKIVTGNSAISKEETSSSTRKGPKVETEPSMAASAKRPGEASPEKLEVTIDARPKMVPSRSLQIANNRPRFWRWLAITDSRFGECVELLSVYFLQVTGEIPPRELSAGTSYDVHLVYKLATKTIGLRGSIQTSSMRLHGKQVITTNKVCLEPKAHGMADDVMCPIKRGDGWLELRLAEFVNDDNMLTEEGVIVVLREEDTTIQKSGLIVAGMEFRSK
ncbi:hypothetical protein CFC21_021197 [Triticum aestivum]|uniref:non-specific serine/threonine protein kinase n=3 Tax=Triticum TaxID=4564 RepID=A0A9R1PCT5_TRITD|nr:hypothetical protein CFC21_021197 [Triticum aestivum]VAH41048.1 unnamed protein product [Triticum turgidum subsp. durum]